MRFQGNPCKACPEYFRYEILKARKAEDIGQAYATPGWHLSIRLRECVDDKALDELIDLLLEVDHHCEDQRYDYSIDDKRIIKWFRHYLPKAMKLVPPRRNQSFLDGFWEAVRDQRIFDGKWVMPGKTTLRPR